MIVKKILPILTHPITGFNLCIVGLLLVVQFVHTKAHFTLESDVHGHVHRTLKKNPNLARSTCYQLDL